MSVNMEKLIELRQVNGYTQGQVAKYLGIDQSYLSKIEKGERKITLSIINKLCLLYDCSYHYLFDQSDQYEMPKISFKGEKSIDLGAISKMNQVKNYLFELRQLEEGL